MLRCMPARKKFQIHTFISTSPLHMKHKLNKSPEEVMESIKESAFMLENLMMMSNGLAKMAQEQIWIICVRLLSLQLVWCKNN